MRQIPTSPAKAASAKPTGPVASQDTPRSDSTGRQLLLLVAVYISGIGLLVAAIVFLVARLMRKACLLHANAHPIAVSAC